MKKILVSGLVNIETTIKVPHFPIAYYPITFNQFGIQSAVSGVGVNVSKALTTLGDEVNLMTLIGNDFYGNQVVEELNKNYISTRYCVKALKETPYSVVLYDESGRRQIHCDLKDVQERHYQDRLFLEAMNECNLVVLCNVNFSRPFLEKARAMNKIIAIDVHVVDDVMDTYNADFMRYANILFLSNENILGYEKEFVKRIVELYDNDIIVVGLGAKGALLYVKEDQFLDCLPAIKTTKVVNTVGAGDALFSAFIHFYKKDLNPYTSLKKALIFASKKIESPSASKGFISEEAVLKLYNELY